MRALVEKATEIALQQNGVHETGNNTGREVNQYLRSIGLGPGNPWCAAFVYWCIDEAAGDVDLENPFIKTGFCPTIANWARQQGILHSTPEPGDVFLRYGTVSGEFRACHTGFVTRVEGGQYATIEGNTNTGGSREGIGVFKRLRPINEGYKFVRWAALAPAAVARPTFELFLNDTKIADMPLRDGKAWCPVRRWGQALGFSVGWDTEEGFPLLDGKKVECETAMIGGSAYAPIRDLAELAGLQVDVDGTRVRVSRA